VLFFARETYSNGGASRAPIGVKDNGRMRDFCDDDRPRCGDARPKMKYPRTRRNQCAGQGLMEKAG